MLPKSRNTHAIPQGDCVPDIRLNIPLTTTKYYPPTDLFNLNQFKKLLLCTTTR